MPTPRVFTREEVIEKFLEQVRSISKYWAQHPSDASVEERCDGVVHSLLVVLDGMSIGLPRFILMPDPHKKDKEFHTRRGENYYPRSRGLTTDISGRLHERLFSNRAISVCDESTPGNVQLGGCPAELPDPERGFQEGESVPHRV